MTEYLEIEDALQLVGRYGFHIREIGLLASALTRPATTVMGVEAYPQLAMKAAVLMESLAAFLSADRRQQADCLDADGLDALDQRLPA